MAATRRIGFTDAALVRRLAPWVGALDAAGATDFTGQLSSWLRWTDAQPLFAALQEPIAVAPPADDEDTSADRAEDDCRSVHHLLAHALLHEAPWREAPRPRSRSPSSGWVAAAPPAPDLDYPAYRRHYVAQQQAMEDRIAPLRARLRRVLELRSPALARLAALDAVIERVLAEPERRLLAGLPALLEKRFTQLRAAAAPADANNAAPAAPARWQTLFQHDLDALLQAELDLRWQPIEGLLCTLRAS
jgi:hypothetical protein